MPISFMLRLSFLELRRQFFDISIGNIPILRSVVRCCKECISCCNQAYLLFKLHVPEVFIFLGNVTDVIWEGRGVIRINRQFGLPRENSVLAVRGVSYLLYVVYRTCCTCCIVLAVRAVSYLLYVVYRTCCT